jgi:hypothetical protein
MSLGPAAQVGGRRTANLAALEALPEDDHALRWRVLLNLGQTYTLDGWLAAATMLMEASLAVADDPVASHLSRSYLAWVDLSTGRTRRARSAFRSTYERAEGWAHLPVMSETLIGLRCALGEQGHLGEAMALLDEGEPGRVGWA